jgi:thymidylate synthase (FAD)
MDPRFRVETIAATPEPNRLVWRAMHTDYCEDFVADQEPPDERKAAEICVRRLLASERMHGGPYEHPQISFNVGWFPHSVMQQARTHRVAISFDVQCLSSDSAITFVNINGSTSKKLTKTIGELYDLWTNGESAVRQRFIAGRNGEEPGEYRRDCKKRIKKMRIRSLNEETNTFTYNHIKDVVHSGTQPVYLVKLEDGKSIKCTKNHKILTPSGWKTLADLDVKSSVMANGIPLANADKTYQSKEWLADKFAAGMIPKEVAALAGCSAESVKKWAYIHRLTWQKRQWNAGIKYNINISEEERERRRQHAKRLADARMKNGAPKGENHPSWKPDVPVEKRVYYWLKYERKRIIAEKGGRCCGCGSTQKLHVHHIKPVKQFPELAYDEDNMEILCATCHAKHHKAGTVNPLCAHPVKIKSIEYVGLEQTYDLVLEDPHHNFVANGIVVHNSSRYTGQRILDIVSGKRELEEVFYLRPLGNYSDRQGKKYEYTQDFRAFDLKECMNAARIYADKIAIGFAEEHARGMIPFDFRQHFVVSFNARSLCHFLDLRSKADAQIEIRWLCELLMPRFREWMPELAEWYASHRYGKARLAP